MFSPFFVSKVVELFNHAKSLLADYPQAVEKAIANRSHRLSTQQSADRIPSNIPDWSQDFLVTRDMNLIPDLTMEGPSEELAATGWNKHERGAYLAIVNKRNL